MTSAFSATCLLWEIEMLIKDLKTFRTITSKKEKKDGRKNTLQKDKNFNSHNYICTKLQPNTQLSILVYKTMDPRAAWQWEGRTGKKEDIEIPSQVFMEIRALSTSTEGFFLSTAKIYSINSSSQGTCSGPWVVVPNSSSAISSKTLKMGWFK